jgi:hypothetical protein
MEHAKCVKLTKANRWGCIFESVGCSLRETKLDISNEIPSRFIVNGLEIACKQIVNKQENKKPAPTPTLSKDPVKRATMPNNSTHYPSTLVLIDSFPSKNRVQSNVTSSINAKSGAASGSGSSDSETIKSGSSSGSESIWGSEMGLPSVPESGIGSTDTESRSGSDSKSTSEDNSGYQDSGRHHQPCKKTKAPQHTKPCSESPFSVDEGSKSYMLTEQPQPCKNMSKTRSLPIHPTRKPLSNAVKNWTIWNNETLAPLWSFQPATIPPVSTELSNLSSTSHDGEGENVQRSIEIPSSSLPQEKSVLNESRSAQGSNEFGDPSAPSLQPNIHELPTQESMKLYKATKPPCIKSKLPHTKKPCTASPPTQTTTTAQPSKRPSKYLNKALIPTAQVIDVNGTDTPDISPASTASVLSSPEPSSSSPSPEPSQWPFQSTFSSPTPSSSRDTTHQQTSTPVFVSSYAICHIVRRVD